MRVFKLGEFDPRYPSSHEEIARRLQIRLKRAVRRAELAEKQTVTAEATKEKLAAKLRELGLDPDAI